MIKKVWFPGILISLNIQPSIPLEKSLLFSPYWQNKHIIKKLTELSSRWRSIILGFILSTHDFRCLWIRNGHVGRWFPGMPFLIPFHFIESEKKCREDFSKVKTWVESSLCTQALNGIPVFSCIFPAAIRISSLLENYLRTKKLYIMAYLVMFWKFFVYKWV